MYEFASELNNILLETYFDEYNALSDTTVNKMDPKYDRDSLFLKTCNIKHIWFENE